MSHTGRQSQPGWHGRKSVAGQGRAEEELTLFSFIRNPSLTNGLRLMIFAPSFRSKNIFFRSSFRAGGNTSLLTSCPISPYPTFSQPSTQR